jgi:hypothetical protein
MQASLQRDSKLDDISILSDDNTNKLFINYIQDLPIDKLKEIAILFLYHSEYLDDLEDENEDESDEDNYEEYRREKEENEPKEGEITEYIPDVPDEILLQKMKEYQRKEKQI